MAEAPGDSDYSDYEQGEDDNMDDAVDDGLKEHVKLLKMTDSILETGAMKLCDEFLEMGGDEGSALRCLSGGYKGLPLMINVLIDWLHFTGCRKKDIQSIVEDHMKDMILKHFDPKKADMIFTAEGSTPQWLEEMVSYPTWRELFYQLVEQYPDCLMLKFTLKLISDAGYQSEISNAPTSGYQPGPFCDMIKNIITDVISDIHPGISIQDKLKEFCQLVCQSQMTYFYIQSIVKSLEKDHWYFSQWLGSLIQREALRRNLDVTNMSLHFNGVGSCHARVFDSLSSMLGRNALNPADVSALYNCYSDPTNPPPVKFLHNNHFLELLVQALFRQGSTINPDHKDKYLYLLAYASSVYNTADGDLITDDLSPTRDAITTAHTICGAANDSYAELLTGIGRLFDCMRYPIVSMGVFRWVESTVTDPSFFEVSAETSSLFLVLLDEIATYHHLQHQHILVLLQRLLEASYPSLEVQMNELKMTLLDRLIHVLSCGHVIPVINYINKCMNNKTLDHSMIRYFVSEVLNMIEPPYSSEFTTAFLPLVQNEEITSSLITQNKSDNVSLFLCELMMS
jgi:negative elongation factor C/D